MASSKEYVEFIMGQLSLLEGVRNRAMMGEYVLYYQDKVVGGIYDDRFLALLVDDVDDKEYLAGLFKDMYSEIPMPKVKKKK